MNNYNDYQLMKKIVMCGWLILVLARLGACSQVKTKKAEIAPAAPVVAKCDCEKGVDVTPVLPAEPCKATDTKAAEVKIPDYGLLKLAAWEDVDGINQANLLTAWPAWMQSCSTLINKPQWSGD